MSESKKSQKVKKIENNIVIYYSDDEKSTKHTVESKKLLSIARRARTVQPNQGRSKKSSNFYQQLFTDYSLNKKFDDNSFQGKEWQLILHEMIKPEHEKYFKEWLKKNKSNFSLDKDETKQMGIVTDYHDQYDSFAEIRIDEVLYDNNDDSNDGSFEKDVDSLMEFNDFSEKMNHNLQIFEQQGFNNQFLQDYKDIEMFKFDLYTSSNCEWNQVEQILINAIKNKKNIESIDTEAYAHLLIIEKKYKNISNRIINNDTSLTLAQKMKNRVNKQ